MPACSFCKRQYDNSKGLTIFTMDGRAVHYCSGKCRKNANMKRDPKKTAWVKKVKKKSGFKKEDGSLSSEN